MKVLNIINNLGSGGAEKLLVDTVPLLNKHENIQVEILLLTQEKNVFDTKLDPNIKLQILNSNSIYNPLNILKIKKTITEGNYDIVHAHLFPTNYWVSLSKLFFSLKDTKFIATEHSSNNKRRGKFYLRVLEKIIYSQYDKIICITKEASVNLKEWIRPNKNEIEKYIVIKNGIDIERYKNAIPYLKKDLNSNFDENTKLISMVSRFSEAKDQATLIRSMAKLPLNVHLLLIGEGDLINELKKLSVKLNVENRVHFLGFRDDIERILKTSDINVLSSHWEGLSLFTVEAMASGKPFVGSDVQGIREVVKNYGLLFEHENSNELANLLNQLLRDKKLYKETAVKCSKRAEVYSIHKMVDSIIRVYNNVI